MAQRFVLDVEYLHDEVETVILRDLEDIPSYQLFHQGLAQLRSDLQGINPEGKKYLDDALNVLLLEMLLQFGLMFLDDSLTDEFAALHASLVDDDLMMFAQLYLVILDGFIEGIVLVAALLDIVDDLEEVDGDRKDLPTRLQHLLVLLHLRLVLLLQLLLILGLAVGTTQHRLQLGLAHPR